MICYLRLTQSLIGLSLSSYWLAIRLTRYRAHPPHTFIHIHILIRQENFYLSQCIDTYQSVKAYDYSIDYYSINISKSIRPDTIIFQINATSKDPIENGNIIYDLINSSDYFFINQQTGIIRLKKYLPSTIMNFTLTIKAFENDINLTDYTNL
ncbi:unnamed protein product, partial [Rotaria sordida]